MKTTFLGQGFESSSIDAIGNYLIKYLNQQDFHSFTGISAFASEAGIFGLSGHILTAKNIFKNLSLIVGIDQEGTSKEALEEILNLNIDSYIFYQTEAPIFHPKIYLFEGDKEIKLIVGSSNLTGTGLFRNIESSLLIEFDIDDKEGAALLTTLKTYYKTLFDFSDNNLFKITKTVIDDFNARGIVPDEIERRKIYSNKKSSVTSSATPNANTVNIPKRATAKIPDNFPVKPKVAATVTPVIQPNSTATPITGQSVTIMQPVPVVSLPRVLVWQKLSLSQSDAQQVPDGTAITGNLKLSQARFRINNIIIDQTTYFRNQVFNNLQWIQTKINNSSYEEAHCSFDITILGNPIGVHTLKLSHDPIRIAGQGNTPTWLHWGNSVLHFLQQTNITGRTLNLYKAGQSFFIEII
jgi:HKD family nuclease